jgi:hypothetical protein
MARRRSRRQRRQQDDVAQERELWQLWQQRVGRARRLRTAWEQRYQVETLERYCLGFHSPWEESVPFLDARLNLFYATVQAQRPGLLPAKLTFLVRPKAGQQGIEEILIRGMGGVLDAIALQDGHFMQALRLATTQAFFRMGVLKCTYDPHMEPNPRQGMTLYNEVDQAALDRQGRTVMEPDELLTDEVYRWQWVHARNMLLPDEGPDRSRWSWIGEEIEVPLREAKEDMRFPAELRGQMTANGRLRYPQATLEYTEQSPLDQDTEIFRYLECWDIRQGRLIVWAEGQSFEEFLINDTLPEGVEDHPYALLLPVPILGPEPSPWPKPLTFDWLPLQQDYNVLRGQQINAGKRAARKILYDKSTFPDVDEARKFLESPTDMEGCEIVDINHPPIIMGDGALSLDVARNIPSLLADWQRITGVTGTRLGAADSGTATEAVIAEQNATVRDNELRTVINEWLSEAGRKMLQLVRQTLTLDMWVQLRDWNDSQVQRFLASPGFRSYVASRVGPENVEMAMQMGSLPGMQAQVREKFAQIKPMRVSRSQLQFEADVDIQSSTIRPLYRAQLLQLAGILGPLVMTSPTFLEEVLASFEVPQGEQIAQELLAGIRQQAQAKAGGMGMGQNGMVPGTPNAQSAGSPLGTQNPLGAVSATGGL